MAYTVISDFKYGLTAAGPRVLAYPERFGLPRIASSREAAI